MKIKIIIIVAIAFLLVGCATIQSIRRYQELAPSIQLGVRIDALLPLLAETKKRLPPEKDKSSVQYIDEMGNEIYIFFARSSNIPSDISLLDEEFTPYIFYNEVLVAIGWESINRGMHMASPGLLDIRTP